MFFLLFKKENINFLQYEYILKNQLHFDSSMKNVHRQFI